MAAKNVDEVTWQSWAREVFPEWGTWLNEEIDRTRVERGTFVMWWLANMGVWIKSDQQTSIAIDLWCGSGKRTHDVPNMSDRHQYVRSSGASHPQPNLRIQPIVIDPFSIRDLDALLVTHVHHDHLDLNVAAAILQNVDKDIPFIGPKYVTDQWMAWGVPRERCVTVRPGDVIQVGDIEITVTDSFDRTALITDCPGEPPVSDTDVPDMADRSVSYVVKTSAGTIYHGGDSHFSTSFSEQGKAFDIDVALLAYAENPPSIQDKMTSSDILRAAEALDCRVVIPLHWDIWSNTLADPYEIVDLWETRRERMRYPFNPFAWLPGGRFVYPRDIGVTDYAYDRGLEDHHTRKTNLPYKSFL
jgi:L-ascorbate 6-phosphate lactonase